MDSKTIKIELPLDEIMRTRAQIYNTVPNLLFHKAVEFINIRLVDYWEARAFAGGEEFITEAKRLALSIRLHGMTETDMQDIARRASIHQDTFEVFYDITTDFICYFKGEINEIVETLIEAASMFHGLSGEGGKPPKADKKFWIFGEIDDAFLSRDDLRNYLTCNPWLVTVLLIRHIQTETIDFIVEGSRQSEVEDRKASEADKKQGAV